VRAKKEVEALAESDAVSESVLVLNKILGKKGTSETV